MKRRKWISLLLCGTLILATLPTTALAEGTEMEADAGVQVESVNEEVPVEEQTEEVAVEETLEENEEEMPEETPAETPAEAPEANPEPDSEETPEEIVEIKEEETVEEVPEEKIPEENLENTVEEVPAETEQESISDEEENPNPEETAAALTADNKPTTLESPGIAVQAGTSVTYYDENGAEHTADCNGVITQENIENYETLTTGWYAVEGTVTGDSRIKVEGSVNLILKDGCSFTVNGGIEVSGITELLIWGQQEGNGKLNTQNVAEYCAGIGGGKQIAGGRVVINGGEIEAIGGNWAAGIGGGYYGNGGNITINRGIVRSEGYGGAGIGGGFGSFGDKIFIHGGEIHATGKSEQNGNVSGSGAGIGGGHAGDGGQITITGGRIEAKGEAFAAGIGGGYAGPGGNITIQGGIVIASTLTNADELFAIGSGKDMSGGSVSITNGFVTTTGKIDPSGKAGWSGIIFENSETDGIVYGDPTLSLSQEVTLKTSQNVLIPENTSLQGTANLTNKGNIYVSGTLAESVNGSGNVHYALTVTDGTAEGDVSTYKNQLYGKKGGSVTLNATNVPAGLIMGNWTCSDDTVTVTNNTFTMPAKALTFTPNYLPAVTYWDPVNQKNETAGCNAILKADNISQYTTLSTGWYAVEGTVTGNTRIKVQGTVNLILEDDCSFTVNGGIEVNGGNALTIWGQQKGNGELKTQNVRVYCAGIGGGDGEYGGNITVAGGSIIANGGYYGAGIGGGAYGDSGMIKITGGKIEAKGGSEAAGIGGGGMLGRGRIITITGGEIEAKGGDMAAGIGGGSCGNGGDIQIQDSIVYSSISEDGDVENEFAIAGGRFDPRGNVSIKDSVVITRGKIDESNKAAWNGMIFENSETDGIIYGNPTLSQKFTLKAKQNLLIPENISLQGTAKLINEGNIYVHGTLAEPVSGKVYYPLTIVDGTAEGSDVSTYKDQLYGRADGTITLKGTNVPAGQAAVWKCSDDTVTVTNNTFTMPAKALTFTPKYVTPVIYWDPVNQKNETAGCNAILTADNISQYTTLPTGWYAVEGTVTGNTRIEVQGTVNLILEDGCSFTANGGIEANEGNALTIWGQQEGNGELKAENTETNCAGIGGEDGSAGGNITINGGVIIAVGGSKSKGFGGAGIGGGSKGSGGVIIINGGDVTATSGICAAGIGGGIYAAGGTITINDGKIYSKGWYGAGIGGGSNAAGGSITINGGEINAIGEEEREGRHGGGAGIGGGFGSAGGMIFITGGKINAKGGDVGAGIGGGNGGGGGNIQIQGGVIYASTYGIETYESRFDRWFAIGAGGPSTDGSVTIINSVVTTRGQINKSNKDTWSGIIFENSEKDGIVYGDPTLSQEFTLETKQNLLIPENTSLRGTTNLTNGGNIYVSGTLAESVSGSGKVHYALTVTGGTAKGDISTYKDQLYGKTGGSVTLNATNVPVGQAFNEWNCSDDTVTIANDTFTMPAKKLTVTAQYINAPTYTVTIPATVELGNTAAIQAEDVNVVSGSQLVVRLSNADGWKLTTPEGAEQLYMIKNGETSIQESDAVLTVAGGTADNSGTVSLNFAPDGATKYAGIYTGTVMFNVSVEAASNP